MTHRFVLAACAAAALLAGSGAAAQRAAPADSGLVRPAPATRAAPPAARARARAPRRPVREQAWRAPGRRLVVSVAQRRLWWMDGRDTLFTTPVAVGKGTRLRFGAAAWNFSTPRGIRRVLAKERDPVWIPPDWHYVELARDSAWTLVRLERGPGVRLADGSRVQVRGDRIVWHRRDGRAELVPPTEEAIFGDTLLLPPLGTVNRRVAGELGAFKLELGDGYMIHGTPHAESIGQAATHGCIRVPDRGIRYLHHHVPVGTPVYLY